MARRRARPLSATVLAGGTLGRRPWREFVPPGHSSGHLADRLLRAGRFPAAAMGVETPNVAGLDGDEALDIVDSWLSDVDGRYSGVREWAWLLVMPELKGPPQQ